MILFIGKTNIMKTTFTLIIALLVNLTIWAGATEPKTTYFICHFTETVSSTNMKDLKKQGFEVIETTNDPHVVYVKSESISEFTNQLKSQMKELIQIETNGDRIYIKESRTTDSPDFLKLFFNFI